MNIIAGILGKKTVNEDDAQPTGELEKIQTKEETVPSQPASDNLPKSIIPPEAVKVNVEGDEVVPVSPTTKPVVGAAGNAPDAAGDSVINTLLGMKESKSDDFFQISREVAERLCESKGISVPNRGYSVQVSDTLLVYTPDRKFWCRRGLPVQESLVKPIAFVPTSPSIPAPVSVPTSTGTPPQVPATTIQSFISSIVKEDGGGEGAVGNVQEAMGQGTGMPDHKESDGKHIMTAFRRYMK